MENQKNKSDLKSGTTNPEYEKLFEKPPTKQIEAINKANDVKARGKAPGSVRV